VTGDAISVSVFNDEPKYLHRGDKETARLITALMFGCEVERIVIRNPDAEELAAWTAWYDSEREPKPSAVWLPQAMLALAGARMEASKK
jgi:hypothetical protein